jgi:very long chain acyl-CoA dehydrogenase
MASSYCALALAPRRALAPLAPRRRLLAMVAAAGSAPLPPLAPRRRLLATAAAAAAAPAPPPPPPPPLPSFTRALFQGKLEGASLFPYPRALSPEQAETLSALLPALETFLKRVNDAAKNDAHASLPEASRAGLRALGAYGMQVPEELGGVGLSNTGYGLMTEPLGREDLGMAIHLGAHQSIGFKGILLFGDAALKAKYLPQLAAGEHVAAFSLTEPSSGSDANSVKSRAVRQPDGSWRLSGAKLWTSNGGEAAVFTVFAQTAVRDEATGQEKDRLTAFVVERAFGGVTNGPPEKKMGIKCSNTAEVFYDSVPVPAANVLGGVGNGFAVAMAILNAGRFGMGCMLSGTMKGVLRASAEHASQRSQFGRKLKDYGAVKGKVAGMAARTFAAESVAFALAANMDRGMPDFVLEAAVSKVFASEAAWYVADEGIQVHGGQGFMAALPLERMLRDLRIFRIFEGTNEILRLLIAGEGLKALGKQLRGGSPLATGLAAARSALGMTPAAPRLPAAAAVPARLRAAAEAVEEGTAAFGAACAALLLKHGKGVAEQQLALLVVADVAIDLTAMAATVARAAHGGAAPAHELDLAELFCAEAGLRVAANLALLEAPGAAAAKRGASFARINELKVAVADAVFANGGYAARHPTGLEI